MQSSMRSTPRVKTVRLGIKCLKSFAGGSSGIAGGDENIHEAHGFRESISRPPWVFWRKMLACFWSQ